MTGRRAYVTRTNASISCDSPECPKTVVADTWTQEVYGARRKAMLLGWGYPWRWNEEKGRSVHVDLCPTHHRQFKELQERFSMQTQS